jgi:hypothetical protein
MYKTINKSQPERAQVDTPNPRLKIRYELIYSQKNISKESKPILLKVQYSIRVRIIIIKIITQTMIM